MATMGNTQAIKNKVGLERQVRELAASDPDLMMEAASLKSQSANVATSTSPNASETPTNLKSTFRFVPLGMGGNGRTHVVTAGSAALLQSVTVQDLQKMTDLFYEKAFADQTLDKFIRSHDDPHGARFAKWIHQKLSGSTVWDHDRKTRDKTPVKIGGGYRHVVHDRSSAHVAAWHSPKRPEREQGRHFKLDECRVWMRLHFWALRESGLVERAPSFADYYVRFIGHFVRVYEGTAPAFARDSFRWSANPSNLEAYIANNRRMTDVLGLTLKQAEAQIPAAEAHDPVWPYNNTPPEPSQ